MFRLRNERIYHLVVDADRAGRGLALKAVSGKKKLEDVDRNLLRSGQEDPGMSATGIGNKAVRILAVMR